MESIIDKIASKEQHDIMLWPALQLNEWEDTYSYVHLCTQVVGKIKLQLTPFINHWWNTTFSLSSKGITTGIIPYNGFCFQIEFDFKEHHVSIELSNGRTEYISLKSGTVADFYFELKEKLQGLGIEINIWTVPVEIDDRLPFDHDFRIRSYNGEYMNSYWRALIEVSKCLSEFRSPFIGKASSIHFFWGSFDLALTFFSGRPAPEHPGAPNVGRKVMAESYNSELASFGFWGGKGIGEAAFYAYSYPEPEGYKNFKGIPEEAHYNDLFREFVLPYAEVKKSMDPENLILNFYRSTYKAVAELSKWDKGLYKG